MLHKRGCECCAQFERDGTDDDISEGEFWCELAELLGETTKGRDGVDAPLQMTRRRALELVRELQDDRDELQGAVNRIASLIRKVSNE